MILVRLASTSGRLGSLSRFVLFTLLSAGRRFQRSLEYHSAQGIAWSISIRGIVRIAVPLHTHSRLPIPVSDDP